ncbi:MAG: hypothetical protein AAFQ43_02990, partial [Bacteroidota bacterium]
MLITLVGCDGAEPGLDVSTAALGPASAPLVEATSPTDPAIDVSDTWVRAGLTVTYAGTVRIPERVRDATTGERTRVLGLDEPPKRFLVEAGYDQT